jgi:hypothetical protein
MEITTGATLTGNQIPDPTDEQAQSALLEKRADQAMGPTPAPEMAPANARGAQKSAEEKRRRDREQIIERQQRAEQSRTDENRFRQDMGITAVAGASAFLEKNKSSDPLENAENIQSAISTIMSGGLDLGEMVKGALTEEMKSDKPGEASQQNAQADPSSNVVPIYQPTHLRRD